MGLRWLRPGSFAEGKTISFWLAIPEKHVSITPLTIRVICWCYLIDRQKKPRRNGESTKTSNYFIVSIFNLQPMTESKSRSDLFYEFIKRPYIGYSSEIITIFVSFYFIARKAGLPSSTEFAEKFLKPEYVEFPLWFALVVIFLSAVVKCLMIYSEKFRKPNNPIPTQIKTYSHPIVSVNIEIEEHLEKLRGATLSKADFLNFHSFKRNSGALLAIMANHICESLKGKSVNSSSICISLYTIEEVCRYGPSPENLRYLIHSDSSNHQISTDKIDLKDSRYAKWAMVQGVLNKKVILLHEVTDSNFEIEGSERRKEIKSFIGVPILVENHAVGFLNIEFHLEGAFKNFNEIQKFYSEHIFGFKCLMEYQCLKKIFFKNLADKLIP